MGDGPAQHALPTKLPMRDQLSDAKRTTRVTSRRLNPQALERSFAQQAAIANAVERDATREHQILETRLLMRGARHAQHDLLADDLDRSCQIHLLLREVRLRFARRAAEQFVEGLTRHGETS